MGVKAFSFEHFCSELSLAGILGDNTSLSHTHTHTLANVRDLCVPLKGRIASIYSYHYIKWIKTVTQRVCWCLISEGSIHAVVKGSPKKMAPVSLLMSSPSHTNKLKVTCFHFKKKEVNLLFPVQWPSARDREHVKHLNWAFRSYRLSAFLSMLCFKNPKQIQPEIAADRDPLKTENQLNVHGELPKVMLRWRYFSQTPNGSLLCWKKNDCPWFQSRS